MNRYEKILARKDKKRPHYLCELQSGMFDGLDECFVLKVTLLTPHGSKMDVSWSEKDFPEQTKETLK